MWKCVFLSAFIQGENIIIGMQVALWELGFKFLLAIYAQSILGICYCRLHKQQRGMEFLQSQMKSIATLNWGQPICAQGYIWMTL